MGGLKGSQVKFFVPADVSMVSITNIFSDSEMINLKIIGFDLFWNSLSPHFSLYRQFYCATSRDTNLDWVSATQSWTGHKSGTSNVYQLSNFTKR